MKSFSFYAILQLVTFLFKPTFINYLVSLTNRDTKQIFHPGEDGFPLGLVSFNVFASFPQHMCLCLGH